MNKNPKETKEFFKEFNKLLKTKNKVLLCPSFPCIPIAREAASKNISIGAQDVFFEEKGEFTGEVSLSQIKDSCNFVILGHSDRRHKFSESNQTINKKVQVSLKAGFNVILCIGETLEERNSAKTNFVLEKQLKESLLGISFSSKLFIAYEPVWAIGTGKNAISKDIISAHSFIKEKLIEILGKKANQIKILYGGSVKPENAKEILLLKEVGGVLVGGASLDPQKFAFIANYKK